MFPKGVAWAHCNYSLQPSWKIWVVYCVQSGECCRREGFPAGEMESSSQSLMGQQTPSVPIKYILDQRSCRKKGNMWVPSLQALGRSGPV